LNKNKIKTDSLQVNSKYQYSIDFYRKV